MRTRRLWVMGFVFVALAVAVFALRDAFLDFLEDGPDDYGQGQSVDLSADLRLMWRTQALPGNASTSQGQSRRASTPRAVKAASRVFNTVDLIGLTREEVIARIGDPRTSSDSVYNFPFYPADPGAMVYRFDTGSYGWQFNIHFDADGRVKTVQRLGIE
jgi:hypothetical protein